MWWSCKKLGVDKAFFKGSLWLHLKGLYGSRNIKHFRQHFPDNVVVPNVEVLKMCDAGALSNSTEHVKGEGTCGT
jgi:hypothetical protein